MTVPLHRVKMTVVALTMRHVLTNNVLHALIAHLHNASLIVMHRAAILIVMLHHALNNHVVLKMRRIALMLTVHVVPRLRALAAVMTQHVTLIRVSFLHVI
jgi:hypothetical protein